MILKRWLVGLPLKTKEAAHERLSKRLALAVFSSDALSSVAYATEEILLVLTLAGTAMVGYSIPLSLSIIGLLVILTMSYRQIIFEYPEGGGAYIVGKSNLGEWPGLVAAAALMIDYVLTVNNAGPSDAANLTVTDSLPAGTTFVSASGTGWTCNFASPTVTCTRPNLVKNTAAPNIALTIKAPNAAGTVTNTAAVSSADSRGGTMPWK